MSIRDKIDKFGWAFIDALYPKDSLDDISHILGETWTGLANHVPHSISPIESKCATPNTYSGNYGLLEYPMHTDLAHWRIPPRYLILRCIIGFPAVKTLLVDGVSIIEECGKSTLSKALVEPRRPLDGKIPLLRLYRQYNACTGLFRWDSLFIQPKGRKGEIAFERVTEFIADTSPTIVNLKSRGDTLILDNWRILHGRTAVPKHCKYRTVERLYLDSLK